MSAMFSFQLSGGFNQDLSNWNLDSIEDMSQMFFLNNFFNNGGLDLSWNITSDPSGGINMSGMFQNSFFNQSIGSWNVSKVTNMSSMFQSNTIFNKNIGSWITTKLNNIEFIFYGTSSFNNGGSSGDTTNPINWNPVNQINFNNSWHFDSALTSGNSGTLSSIYY